MTDPRSFARKVLCSQCRIAYPHSILNVMLSGLMGGVIVVSLMKVSEPCFPFKGTTKGMWFVYAVLLLVGAWRVQPRGDRERGYPLVVLLLAVQFVVFLAYWIAFAVRPPYLDSDGYVLGGPSWGLTIGVALAFYGGPVLLIPLRLSSSRGGILMLGEVFVAAVIVVAFATGLML